MSSFGPPYYRRDVDTLVSRERPLGKVWTGRHEHVASERLREMGLYSQEERWLWRGNNDSLQQPYALEKVFLEVHSERTRGNKHKMQQEKFCLDIQRKKFHRSGPETGDKDTMHAWWY